MSVDTFPKRRAAFNFGPSIPLTYPAVSDGSLSDIDKWLLLNCYKAPDQISNITVISPTSGNLNTTVTITGTGFGDSSSVAFIGTSRLTIISWSSTQVVGRILQTLSAGTHDVIVYNSTDNTVAYSENGFTGTSAVTTLNRQGIADIIEDLLESDTGTLYGTNNYLQYITSDPTKYTSARIERAAQYALFIWVNDEDTGDVRMQNADDIYSVDLKYVGFQADAKTTINQLDNAHETVVSLIRAEMWNGTLLCDYHNDTNAQIIDITVSGSSLPPPEEGTDSRQLTFTLENAITIMVNRRG